MIKKIIVLLLISICGCNSAQEASEKLRVIEYQELEHQKSLIKKGDKKAVENYNKLIKQVDKLLNRSVFSVVNKVGVPPSKSKHDYMSIGPYWWPNPETADGLPYIRKDGEINPETRNNYTDFVENENFLRAIRDLSNAYYLSDNISYANRALKLINTWFLDADTKMNPNLNYGQSIPGKNDGRCFGIIEFGGLVEILKCLEVLEDRNQLDDETKKGMESWLSEYADWLQNSELGKEEATRENNHGTHYDIQLLNILLYLNRADEVKNHLSTITKARIFSQIEPDGSQPRELKRTKSFSYSTMNLHGFMELVRIGQKVGIALWNIESEDGRSIKKGYQYMVPYLIKEKEWEHKQITSIKSSEAKLIADLNYVSKTLKDTSFDKALHLLNQKNEVKN
ncbi:alginate lyase family protein [Winogradskyella litoriviva]|uniref:Alginate lyase family protein n=1 Tax=Winogradskyella litoriviva TaxID=1220182 RepID=A0ABX2E3V8_9FLAO|nr:alginate lyase family protein [Winogradskyella litoriviva]NRD23040.1 alginate lyase family protein [Winogradskyella litoriviva]